MKLNVFGYLYLTTRGLARLWIRLTNPRLSRELLRPIKIAEAPPERPSEPRDWNLSAGEKRARLLRRRRKRW
jgi:hypothetical protein